MPLTADSSLSPPDLEGSKFGWGKLFWEKSSLNTLRQLMNATAEHHMSEGHNCPVATNATLISGSLHIKAKPREDHIGEPTFFLQDKDIRAEDDVQESTLNQFRQALTFLSQDAEGEGCVTEGREAEDTARDTSVEAANVDRVLSGCWPMIEQQSDGTRFQPAFDEVMSHIIQGSSCLLLLYREPWKPDQLPHSAFYQVTTLPNQDTMGQYLVIGQVASQSPGSDAQGLPPDHRAWDEASSLDSLSPPRERAQGRMSQQT
ncbi:hypothetical protein DB88DRAFT_512290 [Papiliotrema laurentii]|uniref:Uncharacterized protein n=1 Tax=Papiliotrema laurentii TaxID=5418 RepID=A0AAD9CWB5_PAPLA|nr:hypothetical protein DB88DRAFT_512290 [Papiliotrema laurentii]